MSLKPNKGYKDQVHVFPEMKYGIFILKPNKGYKDQVHVFPEMKYGIFIAYFQIQQTTNITCVIFKII